MEDEMTIIHDSSLATTTPGIGPVDRGARLRRRVAGISMISAAGLSLAGFLATPWENGAGTDNFLGAVAAHPVQQMVAATILHFGYLLFVPAAFVLARLARRGAPWLSGIGLVLSVLGAGLSGLVITDAYDVSIALHAGPVAGAPISDMQGVPGALVAMVGIGAITGFGAQLGLVLVAAAMRRARLAPFWPAVVILAGWVIGNGAADMLRGCAAFAAVAVGLAYLGVCVLRLSDQRFEHGSDAR
jgi:hypothetical protein